MFVNRLLRGIGLRLMKRSHIGRYELHSQLGQGGMGTVYKCRDPRIDRWVAVKSITVRDSRQRDRFQQEIKAAGSLNHPNITQIYDVGEEGDLAFIVMELVEGDTLASRLSSPVPWRETIGLLLPVCQALAYAHEQGVIHRDVKPSNILVSSQGQVKLTDFGVARLEAALRRVTEPGSTVGTPLYTAPEQIENKTVDGRADIFSLGIVLFELVTGSHPFAGESMAQVVYRITQPEPADLEPLAARSPPAVVDLVGCALSKDPDARFRNAHKMAAALEACLELPATDSLPVSLSHSARPSAEGPASGLRLDVVSNLPLSPAEEALIRSDFAGCDRVYLEREFKGGYSGARVLLVTPFRSGRRLIHVVIKIDTPAAVKREWEAYRRYVQDRLPLITARRPESPHYAEDAELALLRYTFAGELGDVSPESLRTYYAKHSGQDVADLLDEWLFQGFGRKWWLQRSSEDFMLRWEYDRLLPVNLVLEPQESAGETSLALVARRVDAHTCRALKVGQLVQIQGFEVEDVHAAQGEITLQASSPSGRAAYPIRVRVAGLDADQIAYRVGQDIPFLIGKVTATRHDLLLGLAEPALPGQSFDQKTMAIGASIYPNPLYDYEMLLDQRVAAMVSIIHGDMNLENVLVTPPSGPVWLIDFATTRKGHNLYDFIRLETEVITHLLPQTGVGLDAAVCLVQALHQPQPHARQLPAELQKAFVVLAAVRHMARACLHNPESWDEYYLGLVIALLGALKFKTLDDPARRVALAAAAALRGLITIPALQITPPLDMLTPTPSRARPKVLVAGLGVLLLALLVGLGFWFWGGGRAPLDDPAPPPAASVPEMAAVTSSLTPTGAPTSTSPATLTLSLPDQGRGIANGSLDIHSGPGSNYPVLDSVPKGNPVQVTGRSVDGEWWQIAHPRALVGYGWVLAEFVELEEPVNLPVVLASPPPTATRTSTITSTPSDTPAPTKTRTPPARTTPGLSQLPNVSVEDFDAYDNNLLRQTYSVNNAWDKNDLVIEVTSLADATDRGQVLAMVYDIRATAPDNYVGVERTLQATENLSDYSAVQFWVRNDATPRDLIFQWREAPARDGEAWKARIRLEPGDTSLVEIPLSAEYFIWADWSTAGNGQMDLDQVSYYSFFIEQVQPGSGVIYVDSLELVPKAPPSSPQPATPECQMNPAPEFGVLWESYGSELGCATGPLYITPFIAEEAFEGGHLIWRKDTDDVYVIYDRRRDGTVLLAGTWELPPWKWKGEDPAGIGLSPPPGLVEPVRGFGWLWRTHLGGADGPLGWALEEEYGSEYEGRVQSFERGLAFKGSEPQVHALLEDGRFFAASSIEAQPAQLPSICQDTGFRPDPIFAPAWVALGAGECPMGYPLGPATTDRNYAKQFFERGFMFWWDAPQTPQPIWMVHTPDPLASSGDTWSRYEDAWDPTQPEYPLPCPEAGSPLGPKAGFGYTWCVRPGVKDMVGMPLEAEFGSGDVFPRGAVQFFQGGVMIENPADRQVWVLVDGGGWRRFNY